MTTCAVTHDLNNYMARLEDDEREAEYQARVARELIESFGEHGSCSLEIGRGVYKHYDQGHLITNLFEYKRSDKATECFRMALDESQNRELRNAAALAFFNLAEEQMTEDLEMLAVEAWEDDEYCP